MEYEDVFGTKIFTNLVKFALHVLCLPTSNADVERFFLKVNLIKPKARNSLKSGTVLYILAVSETVRAQGGCTKYRLDEQLIKLFKQLIEACYICCCCRNLKLLLLDYCLS